MSDGTLQAFDTENATILNEYFHSIFTHDDNILPPFQERLSRPAEINDINITQSIVYSHLSKLKTNSSCGPDSSPPFFKRCAPSISHPLHVLFRSLLELHKLPAEWKLSIITPKFRKGSPSDPQNYRPISLTCTCCNVMESIITTDLLKFLSTHHLLTKNQHGFLKKHSTVTNLLESINDWTISLTNRKSVIIGYVDFQRAFDVICHSKLIHKLSGYGISGNLLLWIKAFLTNRFHCVKINSIISSPLPVLSGVPQGSVLGPILFNLFINDISDQFGPDAKTKLFADDLKIYTELSSLQSIMNFQKHLNIVYEWSSIWQLPISYSKFNTLHIGSHPPSTKFYFSNTPIAHTCQIRDLGVLFDQNFKFSNHIYDIITRSKQRSCLIFKSFLSRNTPNLILAYKTYVRPLAEYASSIWSPSLINLINDIESIQRNFTKRLPFYQDLPYSERLHKSGLQSLEHRRLIADLILCYNIINGNSAINFDEIFKYSKNKTSRGHPFKLEIPFSRTNQRKSFFSHRVVPPWNSLSASVVLSTNPKSFKTILAKQDLSNFLTFPTTLQ